MKGRPSIFFGRRWGTPSEDSDHLAKLINFLNKGRGYAIRSTSANSRAHNGRLVSSYQIVGALPPMESNHSMTNIKCLQVTRRSCLTAEALTGVAKLEVVRRLYVENHCKGLVTRKVP